MFTRTRADVWRTAIGVVASAFLTACPAAPDSALEPAPESVSEPVLEPALEPVPASALNPELAPSENFDLSHWKLTLPSGAEIQPSELSHGYTLPGVFFTDPSTGGVTFRCPNIAGTTPNSKYSRTELREMLDPTGSTHGDANNWTMEQGGRLHARLKVDRVSTTGEDKKVGRVIIGQIHGGKTEVVRLYFHKKPSEAKGRIYVAMESVAGETTWSIDIVSNQDGDGIALGELFSYGIHLQGRRLFISIENDSGTVRSTYVRDIDPDYSGLNLYFKAGVYNQNNTGEASDYAQATFYGLTHTHP